MPVSRQWTEWHLTPRGWLSGSSRRDGEGNVWRDEPEDRIVTFVFQEHTATVEESWRSKTAEAPAHIERLLVEHGPCPKRL